MPSGTDRTPSPSLSALRAFEAVTRLGSFAAAARELGVTDAAVRQHVRGLEDHFGRALFVRRGRGIEPTEEAVGLATAAASAFERLSDAVARMHGATAHRPIRMTLPPAFAENWLMPRLGAWWQEHPELDLELVPSLRVMDLREHGFDLAIRYGHGQWPGYRAEVLASARYVVVAAPAFAAEITGSGLAELASAPWLFESARDEHREWAEARGIDFDAEHHRRYPTNSLVLSAARAGQGLVLQAHALVARDLEQGDLVELYAEDAGSLAYYLVTREDRAARVELLVCWLTAAARPARFTRSRTTPPA